MLTFTGKKGNFTVFNSIKTVQQKYRELGLTLMQLDLAIDGSGQVDFEEVKKDLNYMVSENDDFSIKDTSKTWKVEYTIEEHDDAILPTKKLRLKIYGKSEEMLASNGVAINFPGEPQKILHSGNS